MRPPARHQHSGTHAGRSTPDGIGGRPTSTRCSPYHSGTSRQSFRYISPDSNAVLVSPGIRPPWPASARLPRHGVAVGFVFGMGAGAISSWHSRQSPWRPPDVGVGPGGSDRNCPALTDAPWPPHRAHRRRPSLLSGRGGYPSRIASHAVATAPLTWGCAARGTRVHTTRWFGLPLLCAEACQGPIPQSFPQGAVPLALPYPCSPCHPWFIRFWIRSV
jgi:hypothetical protein